MRTLELVRLIGAVSLLATAPVVSTVVIYSQFVQSRGALSISESGSFLSSVTNGPAPLAGQNVVTSDGERVGEVIATKSNAEGRIQLIYFRTGGWFGFGMRVVAVPAGEFSVTGQDVILRLNSIDVSNLPESAPYQG